MTKHDVLEALEKTTHAYAWTQLTPKEGVYLPVTATVARIMLEHTPIDEVYANVDADGGVWLGVTIYDRIKHPDETEVFF